MDRNPMKSQSPTSNSQDGARPNSLGVGGWTLGIMLAAFCVVALPAQTPQTPQTPATPPAPQQPSEIQLVISGEPGTPPRYPVPDFVALSPDVADIAKPLS